MGGKGGRFWAHASLIQVLQQGSVVRLEACITMGKRKPPLVTKVEIWQRARGYRSMTFACMLRSWSRPRSRKSFFCFSFFLKSYSSRCKLDLSQDMEWVKTRVGPIQTRVGTIKTRVGPIKTRVGPISIHARTRVLVTPEVHAVLQRQLRSLEPAWPLPRAHGRQERGSAQYPVSSNAMGRLVWES